MKPRLRNWLFLSVTSLALGCQGSDSKPDCSGDKCDALAVPWVVDLHKTGSYGYHSSYFWGLTLEELDLGDLEAVIDQQGLDQLAKSAFEPFKVKEATFKIVWDQLQNVAQGWPTIIFEDLSAANENLSDLNASLGDVATALAPIGIAHQDGMKYQVVLIDQQGRAIAAPGNLDIIPMLQNTAPNEQKHIVRALDDGDVISYVHPEQGDMAGLLERRASHVAMHYEEGDVVHHIDNPDSYGPPYNHAPDRNMPFHAFRFQPKGVSEEVAAQYRKAARNWAFMTNDLSPFADYFDLRLKTMADLDKFVDPILDNEEMPNLYCSGLAYTNLNLGANKPQNAAGLGAGYDRFSAGQFYFSDTNTTYRGPTFEAPPSLEPFGKLVFEPYTGIDMLNVWLGNAFRGLPPALHTTFLPEFLKQDQLHQLLADNLAHLQWSDAEYDERFPNEDWVGVSNAFNVKAWALAYAMELQGKTGSDLHEAGLTVIVDARGTENPLAEVIDAKDAANSSPLQVMAMLYDIAVDNLFVPPRIWIDEGQHISNNLASSKTAPRNMQYVGTVINCELLTAANGSSLDPCEGGGQGQREYAEGGADTHIYEHYAVRENGERTHRRIDASPGPELFGIGTVVTLRMTGITEDTAFALHVPEHWQELPEHADDTIIAFDRFCNDQWRDNTGCAPRKGIYLDPTKLYQGTVHNQTMRFVVIGTPDAPCKILDEETLSCMVIDLDSHEVSEEVVSRRSHGAPGFDGHFTATMLDLGNDQSTSDCQIRDELDADNPGRASGCMNESGSGHYDGFHIRVSNRADVQPPDEEELRAMCEDHYVQCLVDREDFSSGAGELCMAASPRACNWTFDTQEKNEDNRPAAPCFPEGLPGPGEEAPSGYCIKTEQCQGFPSTIEEGLCPGPDGVECCVPTEPADG